MRESKRCGAQVISRSETESRFNSIDKAVIHNLIRQSVGQVV